MLFALLKVKFFGSQAHHHSFTRSFIHAFQVCGAPPGMGQNPKLFAFPQSPKAGRRNNMKKSHTEMEEPQATWTGKGCRHLNEGAPFCCRHLQSHPEEERLG